VSQSALLGETGRSSGERSERTCKAESGLGDPKHLGAEIGVISILHTWEQNLLLNPHS
jgi:hypothetical protein